MIRKVMLVFGTRPEAIKMAPVARLLMQSPQFQVKICVTAQHREMLDQVLSLFGITPDYDLDIMSPGQDLFELTSKIVLGMRDVFSDVRPDLVLVHGDTTTCFVTALAAFYEGVAVGHIEAGLRTNDLSAPFPEEANRSLVARLAKYHFAPTERAKSNLLREGVEASRILVTGNTVIDALLEVNCRLNEYPETYWHGCFSELLYNSLSNSERRMVLITGHRRENFGQGVVGLCQAIKRLAANNPLVDFVYPVHLNPNVKKPVSEILSNLGNVYLLEPQEYLPFVYLINRSSFIITDSGGLQEEAPSLGKPVLVTRDVTERPEAVEAGTVLLVGTDTARIVGCSQMLLDSEPYYTAMSCAHNPYGDGKASQRIRDFLASA